MSNPLMDQALSARREKNNKANREKPIREDEREKAEQAFEAMLLKLIETSSAPDDLKFALAELRRGTYRTYGGPGRADLSR